MNFPKCKDCRQRGIGGIGTVSRIGYIFHADSARNLRTVSHGLARNFSRVFELQDDIKLPTTILHPSIGCPRGSLMFPPPKFFSKFFFTPPIFFFASIFTPNFWLYIFRRSLPTQSLSTRFVILSHHFFFIPTYKYLDHRTQNSRVRYCTLRQRSLTYANAVSSLNS